MRKNLYDSSSISKRLYALEASIQSLGDAGLLE